MSDNTNIVAAAAVAALGSNVTTQDNDTTNTTNSTSVDNNDVLSHNDVLSNNQDNDEVLSNNDLLSHNQDNDTLTVNDSSQDNDEVLSNNDLFSNNQDNDTTTLNTNINDSSQDNDDVLSNNDLFSNNQDNDEVLSNNELLSHNQDNDNVLSNNHTNVDLDNVGNTIYDNDQDNDITVDVDIKDSFNTDICDSDWLDLENVNFDVVSLISSDGQAFSLTQVSEMSADSYIGSANVSSGGTWGMGADADGGHADGINSSAPDFGEAGDDGILEGNADASGTADFDAFNQNISMGANIQQNVINLNLVGHDMTDDANA